GVKLVEIHRGRSVSRASVPLLAYIETFKRFLLHETAHRARNAALRAVAAMLPCATRARNRRGLRRKRKWGRLLACAGFVTPYIFAAAPLLCTTRARNRCR